MKQYASSYSSGSTSGKGGQGGQGGDYMKQYASSYSGGSTGGQGGQGGQGGDYMKQYASSYSGGSTGGQGGPVGDYMKQYAGSYSGGSTGQSDDDTGLDNKTSTPAELASVAADVIGRGDVVVREPATPQSAREFATVTQETSHGLSTKFVLWALAGFSLPASLAFFKSMWAEKKRTAPLQGDAGYHPLV